MANRNYYNDNSRGYHANNYNVGRGGNYGGGGGHDFTAVEMVPDYGDDDGQSGEYDNEFSSSHDYGRDGPGSRATAGGGRDGGDGGDGDAAPYSRQYQKRSPRDNYYNSADRRGRDGGLGMADSRQNYGYNSNGVETGMVNTAFQGDDVTDGRNVRETLEMRRLAESGRSDRSADSQGLRHRRAMSQHRNGYDYYRHTRQYSDFRAEPDPDYRLDDPLTPEADFSMEDIKTTWQYLKTLRVRKKSKRKQTSFSKDGDDGLGRSGRSGVSFYGDGGEDGGGGGGGRGDMEDSSSLDAESYEEEIGLPSTQVRTKGLAEKMQMARQLDSAAEVAKQYERGRDSIWEIKQKSTRRKKASAFKRAYRGVSDAYRAISYKLSFWSSHFKEIEGRCGIATTTYFRFTRWLIKINFLVFLIFLCFLYVPQFITWAEPSKNIFIKESPVIVNKTNRGLYQSVSCSDAYGNYVENISDYTGIPVVLDIVKGTGLLEDTAIFYGRYSNLTVTFNMTALGSLDSVSTDFNMSLVYMLVMVGSLFIIFMMIVKTSSKSVKQTIMDLDNKAIASYSNAVFAGWDYCLDSRKTAEYKQNIIYNDLQSKMEEISIKKKQQLRTSQEKLKLFAKRFVINFVVICILGGCFTAIIFTTNFLLEKQDEDLSELESLVVEFLPSIVISFLNLTIPIVFMVLVEKEEYSPNLSTSLTIIRAVFLRISLVGVLLFSIYYRLFHKQDRDPYHCPEEDLTDVTTTCCGNPLWKTSTASTGEEKGSVKCWETYVGQQFYKLAIADFFNVCLVYLGACALRKVLWSKFKDNCLISKVGLAKFDLPVEVLDIVYTQTLCWVGMFFAPLLPTFCLIQTFIYFFVKKFLLLRLCEPPKASHRASRNYSFFQVVLLVTFTIICVLLGYMIGNIQPSKSCGPFRVWATSDYVMFDAVTNEIQTWPEVPRGIFNFFGTVAFFIPAFLLLGMLIYYYWAVSLGYKRLEKLLEEQVKLESYDKQYLLARVDEVIKQGHLNLHNVE